MKLNEFLNQHGMQRQFAMLLKVPQPLLSQWTTGTRKVPAERCPSIERLTDGAVTCEELRPDVDWAFLRGTTPSQIDIQTKQEVA